MLIIHPNDTSTYFLKHFYTEKDDLITENTPTEILDQKLDSTKQLIILGHGTEYGLLAPWENKQFGKYLISYSHKDYLSKINYLVGIWCNANIFATKLGLHGLFSGMVISEINEAIEYGIKTNQEELDIENKLYAERLSGLIHSGISLNKIPDIFPTLDTTKSELTKFNYNSLEYL